MENKKNLKSLRNDKRAVSPVIGVILMVAITVILAAVIGAFVFGISPTGEKAPSVQLRPTVDSADLVLKHIGGDPIDLGDCIVRVGSTDITAFASNLTIGKSEPQAHSKTINAGDAVTVEVIHTASQSYLLDTTVTAQ